MARTLEERFGGEVPTELDDLIKLPGVGRKTGNVVRSVAFELPGLPVDTHVGRLSRRLKLTTEDDPVKAELDLNDLVPPEERGAFSLRLILHGRQVCYARNPRCDVCVLNDICPSAFELRTAGRLERPAGASGAYVRSDRACRGSRSPGRGRGGRSTQRAFDAEQVGGDRGIGCRA